MVGDVCCGDVVGDAGFLASTGLLVVLVVVVDLLRLPPPPPPPPLPVTLCRETATPDTGWSMPNMLPKVIRAFKMWNKGISNRRGWKRGNMC